MDILLMIVWFITTPILIWCRWNGPVVVFDILLILNILCGIFGVALNKDMTE